MTETTAAVVERPAAGKVWLRVDTATRSGIAELDDDDLGRPLVLQTALNEIVKAI